MESASTQGLITAEEFDGALHWIALWFEAAGVAVIVLGVFLALAQAGRQGVRGGAWSESYHVFRTSLARGILLGLEFLVAADIIGTVAVDPTLQSLSVLGLIVLIRTFLSFALQLEISGRWPWQKAPPDDEGAAGSERQRAALAAATGDSSSRSTASCAKPGAASSDILSGSRAAFVNLAV